MSAARHVLAPTVQPLSSRTGAPPSALGWYAICRAFLAAPVPLRRPVSRQTLATYWHVRRLPQAWGEALDQRGAPLAVLRWIAWARPPEERQRRFSEAVTSFDREGCWPRCCRSAPKPEGGAQVEGDNSKGRKRNVA